MLLTLGQKLRWAGPQWAHDARSAHVLDLLSLLITTNTGCCSFLLSFRLRSILLRRALARIIAVRGPQKYADAHASAYLSEGSSNVRRRARRTGVSAAAVHSSMRAISASRFSTEEREKIACGRGLLPLLRYSLLG